MNNKIKKLQEQLAKMDQNELSDLLNSDLEVIDNDWNRKYSKYLKNDFLALKPELVHKLAEPFFNPWKMMKYKGENQDQIRAAGWLIANNKITRPEWFLEKDDYKGRVAHIDYKARNNNTDYRARSKKYAKPVLQYDKKGNFIQEFESAKKAEELLNKKGSGTISMCCRGIKKTAHGFIWKYKE